MGLWYQRLGFIFYGEVRIATTLLMIVAFPMLSVAQGKMPSNSYAIITEASQTWDSNPRKALALLSDLKARFREDSGFDNLDDVLILQNSIGIENSILSLNKHYSKVFLNLRMLEEGSAQFLDQEDGYKSIHYLSRFYTYMYKAQQNGDVLYGNRKYAGVLMALLEEIETKTFKDPNLKEQLKATLYGFMP